jgi:hypothetical protein
MRVDLLLLCFALLCIFALWFFSFIGVQEECLGITPGMG